MKDSPQMLSSGASSSLIGKETDSDERADPA
jgi:hypothetical protein